MAGLGRGFGSRCGGGLPGAERRLRHHLAPWVTPASLPSAEQEGHSSPCVTQAGALDERTAGHPGSAWPREHAHSAPRGPRQPQPGRSSQRLPSDRPCSPSGVFQDTQTQKNMSKGARVRVVFSYKKHPGTIPLGKVG